MAQCLQGHYVRILHLRRRLIMVMLYIHVCDIYLKDIWGINGG